MNTSILEREIARAYLKPIHTIIAANSSYIRVYSQKRKLGNNSERYGIRDNVYKGHRIKYYGCNPSEAGMININAQLVPYGLKAERLINTMHFACRNSIVIVMLRSLEKELIDTFTL